MATEIITALISLIGIILTAMITKNLMLHELDKRLVVLEAKVEAHNKWGEKFQTQTTDIALIKQDINYIKEKLDENH